MIAIIERDDTVLFERRSDAPVWGLIAGRVDDDETVAAALKREVLEETGLEVTGDRLFGVFSDPSRIVGYPGGNVFSVVSFVFLAEVATFDGLRASAESEELRFLPKPELLQLELPATQRHIVERYVAGALPPLVE